MSAAVLATPPATPGAAAPGAVAVALAALGSLDPIGLAELDARAARQVRVDRKYVLPVERLADVAALLAPGVRVLEVGGERASAYRSTYLDTPDLAAYHRAGRRRRRRFKVRTRTYLDTGAAFLEVKTRDGRGVTHKVRRPHDGPVPLSPDAAAFVAAALRDRHVTGVPVGRLRPVLTTEYRRLTLLLPGPTPAQDARATVDLGLRCHRETDRGAARPWAGADPWAGAARPPTLDLGAYAVVETKGGPSPADLDRGLWRLGHRPALISKYGVGMAALTPGLGAAKWRRTLARLDEAVIPPS